MKSPIKAIFLGLFLILSASCENDDDLQNQYNGDLCHEIYGIVQEMPRWPGCENDSQTSRPCTDQKVQELFNNNLQYPRQALINQVEGIVFLSCVIDTLGRIGDCRVLQGLGFGCDEESLRLTALLPDFEIGRHQGEALCVRMNFKVDFKL